jgi:hypothetical protein
MKTIINFEEFWPEENRDTVVPEYPYEVGSKEGLWFKYKNGYNYNKWSISIPQRCNFYIYYNGMRLGWFDHIQHFPYIQNQLVLPFQTESPYKINCKRDFEQYATISYSTSYSIGHYLSLDDFEIVENPSFIG